jgi:uncharacterized protein YecE (DUF72 family)
MARIRVGVGGWTFAPWRGAFYPKGLPQKDELAYASAHLTSIEINGTYYGSQKPESFAKWHDETPDDFVFAVKGPRFATNRRVLAESGESVARFFASGVMELKHKLGPVNWQFMPTKKFDAGDFEGFLKCLPREVAGRAVRHAVEVRHESFCCEEFVALARRYEVAVVVAGDSEFPQIADVTAPFVYVRMMGTVEGQAKGYSKAVLRRWAGRLQAWSEGGVPADMKGLAAPPPGVAGREVFAYVISGHKEKNPAAAMALMDYLT